MQKITLLILFIFIFFSIHRPVYGSEMIEEPVKKLLKDYIKAINTLGVTTPKSDVLKMFNKRYSGNTSYIRISGAIVRKKYSKTDISSQLDDVISDNFKFNLVLTKIIHVVQKEKVGAISALINFETSINEKVAERGTMLVNFVGIKQNDIWKILQNDMVRVSEEKDMGDCICYVYAKGNTKFVTETYFPAGVEYDNELDYFHITRDGDIRTIKTKDGKTYKWDTVKGILFWRSKQVAQVRTVQEVVEASIKHLYREPCVNVNFN